MELFDVTIHYLEMLAPTSRSVAAPRDGLTVVHVSSPTVTYYRSLYDAVGADFRWLSRRKMSDQVLAEIIGNPHEEMHVLHVDGQAAGFAELDRREAGQIELVQFGLTREFIGCGLGKWFLNWTIDKAWSYDPQRIWLHTCTLDHPAAIPNYLKAGFVQFHQENLRREY